MTLGLDSRQSSSGRCRSGMIKTLTRRIAVLRAGAAGRAQGTVCVFTGRKRADRKYFETVRDLRDRGFAWQ